MWGTPAPASQMTETQKRLAKKLEERKKIEAAAKEAEEAEAAAQQTTKKKKRNRKKKKSGAAAAANGEEAPVANGDESSTSPSAASSEPDPSSSSQQPLSAAAKKRRRKAAKKAAAAAAAAEAESSEPVSNGNTPASGDDDAASDEKTAETKPDEKPAETASKDAEDEKLDIDRSTFSEVTARLKELEDQALGRKPERKVKGAENAPGWLGKDGNETVLAGQSGNAKHHVVTDCTDISDKDKAMMQALLGNAKAANTKSYVGLKNVTQTLTSEDYDNKMTVVFQSCHGCHYTLDSLCTKVFITACTDFTLTIDKKVVTQTLELYKCENFTANINVKVRTVQVDMSDRVNLKFNTKENFDNIIWAGVEHLVTEFGDVEDRVETGWTDVQTEFADLNKERSQFKIHYVAGKLTLDKIIRMQDGFPTTKLEYDEHMRRQEFAVQQMAKQMGITINKKVVPKSERAGRNEQCPCGTGKKFKKCCGK